MSNHKGCDYSEQTVETTDKYKIHVKKWTPVASSSPMAQLVIVHGYLEHCGRYAEFAEYLASGGENNSNKNTTTATTVYAFDCRGHGKSSGQRGYCRNMAQYHLDLEAVLKLTDANIPLFVLGHSNGGVIVLDYLRTRSAKNELERLSKWWKGVIISSPFLAPAEVVPAWKVWASKILIWVAPILTVPADLSSDVLTHDEGKRKEHDEDPLNLHSATIGWGYGVQQTQAKIIKDWQPPTVGHLPLLLSFGAADKVADPSVTREFFQRLTSTDKTIDERPDKYHEILNETDRVDLFGKIKDWMDAHLK